MNFYERELSARNTNGEGEVYRLPCNRYMVYSDQFNNCYLSDSKVAIYIDAMPRIFKSLGQEEHEIEFLKTYNTRSTSNPRPLGRDTFSSHEINTIKSTIENSLTQRNIERFNGTCRDFYATFDPECSCCPICYFNKTSNVNTNVDEEETLIKYFTADPKTYSRIKSFIVENMDRLFISKYDLHATKYLGYKSRKPLIIDFFKFLCSVLVRYDDLTYFIESKEAARTDFYDEALKYLNEHYDYEDNPDKATADDIDIKNICDDFIERVVLDTAVVTAETFNKSFKKITKEEIHIENYGVDMPANEQMAIGSTSDNKEESAEPATDDESNADTVDFSNQAITTGPSKVDNESTTSEEAVENEPVADDGRENDDVGDYDDQPEYEDSALDVAMAGYSGESDNEEEMTSDASEYYAEMAKHYTDEDEAPAGEFEDVPANAEDVVDIAPAQSVPAAESETNTEDNKSDKAGESAATVETTALATVSPTALSTDKDEPADAESTDADIVLTEKEGDTWLYPVKPLAENNYIIDNHIDNLADYGIIAIDNNQWYLMQFESSVLTNTYMCIEAVTDSSGMDYLVFYDRMRKTYFSVELHDESECMDIIRPYLTRNKYIKICFQPFYLYAFGRKYNIDFKNVFSIQTCYSYFLKNRPLVGYEEIINFFIDKPLCEYAPYTIPMLLVGMQMYPTICSRCSKKLSDPTLLNDVDAMRYFDEALGRSYYVGDLYKDTGKKPPFKMTGPNQYEFDQEDRGTTLIEGEYFTCQFIIEKKHKLSEEECWMMIKGAIEMLASKGRFRKLHIYITDMNKTMLQLFVPKYNVSYMETSLMSVFSEVNRVKLRGKRYKMIFCQDESKVIKEIGTEEKSEDIKDQEETKKDE